MVAAAERPSLVRALVCRGGRPDLAGTALRRLRAPTLLLVGSEDTATLKINETARRDLSESAQLAIVPGAGRSFDEPGVLATASALAGDWFVQHLGSNEAPSEPE
jgi:putative phosphoribosyl transferase